MTGDKHAPTGQYEDKKQVVHHDEDTLRRQISHAANTGIIIENILAGRSREALLADVDAFVTEHGLEEHREAFEKGALVAQDPDAWRQVSELNEEDRAAFEHEQTHKWSHPFALYFTVLVCAIGAACQGWDQTGSNGANLSFPAEFGIGREFDEPGGQDDEWKVGFVNSCPYIGAALLGCWLSDPLNHYFGRRGEIFITAVILIATPIGSGFAQSWEVLAVIRLIMGIGVGAKVPMFAAELAPANIRGALVMGWQLWTAFGIFLGFCANAVVKDVGRIAWRLQLGSAFIPAVPLAAMIYFCPESPRWLMKKGRMSDAWRAMRRLRFTDVQAARDLYYAYVQYEEERKIVQGQTYFSRLAEIFTIPRCRRATVAAAVVMIAQQMCGINIMAFYSSTIFVEGGFSSSQALFASIGFGALNFVFAIPALFTIDTYGRRTLLLFTFPNMCWSLLAGGMCFFIQNQTARTAAVATFVYIFTIFYSVGEGPVPFMYSAEVFPLLQREQGMAFAVAWNNLWGAALGLTFPTMLRALTPQGAFGFYAFLNALAFVLIYLFVPETKQLTLEELDQVFAVKNATFISYQVKTVLPWWFKRYILRQKTACPPM